MHRRAVILGNYLGTVVTSCGHPTAPYPRRIEKVKFGVPLDEVCKNDIPGPLLVLILKLNKEAPYKKDVFRAPGHQGNMKKLIHFLQNGRLVNIDRSWNARIPISYDTYTIDKINAPLRITRYSIADFSVHTIASVLKKFLRKLPDGIFGHSGEQKLFEIIELLNQEEQRDHCLDHIHKLISSLPSCTQRLIVLLFGTFRVIASNSERSQTGMTSEALGVSVAPSFFKISSGQQAKMEDVMRFKAEVQMATKIMKFLIDNFGVSNLFGRENYEYYARITGRILKVEEDWIFSFRYPPQIPRHLSKQAENTWLQYESERWGLQFRAIGNQDESQSTPALIQASDRLDSETEEPSSSLTIIPENNLLESYTRLSISLEDNGLFKVHERQAARMKVRSEWFLKVPRLGDSTELYSFSTSKNGVGSIFSSSAEMIHTECRLRRSSSAKEKDRRLVRRSSSKKSNKENGTKGRCTAEQKESSPSSNALSSSSSTKLLDKNKQEIPCTGHDNQLSNQLLSEQDCTEISLIKKHFTLTYI